MRRSAFDRLMTSLDHPMAIVTAATRREAAGCLVGFFTQCSIDPPRLCVYLSKPNHTYRVARRASHLMVHFPGRRQRDLAALFGEQTGDEVDKFACVRWRPGPDGRTPRLLDVDAWVFGKVIGRHDAGDHVAHVLEPLRVRAPRKVRQLGYQDVRDLEAAH
ncbi:MAG TPA: flavin reductase family protein [Acidimicrobiales bacterium]